MTVDEVFDALNRHRWWFLGVFILIAAGTMVAYRAVPQSYTANAEVWLDCRADAVTVRKSAGCSGVDRRNERIAERTRLASPEIAFRVIDQLNLGAQNAINENATRLGTANFGTALLANVSVQVIEGSNVATVRYRDTDAERAAEVTNRIVAEYVADRYRTGARAGRIDLRRGQAADALAAMNRAAATATTYRATANTVDKDDPERLRREAEALDVQLADLLARGVAPAGEPTDPDSANGSIRTLRVQLAQLNANRAKLQVRYGPLHPDIISINARIADLIDQIAVLTGRIQRARDAARLAHERIDEQRVVAAQQEQLQSRLDTAVTLAASRYQQSLQDLRAAETLPIRTDAHGLAKAQLVSSPPPLLPTTAGAIGFLAALIGAGCVVVVRELGESGFRNRKVAERKLGLRVIGMVPEAPPGSVSNAVVDLVLSDTAPDFIAAFREINRRLGIGGNVDGPRVIAVTSAFEAEGKTTVSIGIARLAALAGLRVLLIDCDVRRPAATRAIASGATASLADVLAGTVDLAHACVRDTASGAWVLASDVAGPIGQSANGLVGTEAMRKLIDHAKANFQIVLLDMAPVLALAETRVAAAFADCVLLVARWRSTPIKGTRLALDLLKEAEPQAIALVLTRVAP